MAGMGGIILYIVFLGAIVYFMAIRPQNKERKKQQELLASVAVGDTILTSSGFYGVIIDMTDDTVIVEFGSNKTAVFRCRKLPSSRLKNRSQSKMHIGFPAVGALADRAGLYRDM